MNARQTVRQNVLRVLDTLRQRPLSSLRQIGQSAGISFHTASKAMLTLVEMGIARELTGQRRNRVFVYDAYLNVLNEGARRYEIRATLAPRPIADTRPSHDVAQATTLARLADILV